MKKIFILTILLLSFWANAQGTKINVGEVGECWMALHQLQDEIAEYVEYQTGEYVLLKIGAPTKDNYIPVVANSINGKYSVTLSLNGVACAAGRLITSNYIEKAVSWPIVKEIKEQKTKVKDSVTEAIYEHQGQSDGDNATLIGDSLTVSNKKIRNTVFIQLPGIGPDEFSGKWLRTTFSSSYDHPFNEDGDKVVTMLVETSVYEFDLGTNWYNSAWEVGVKPLTISGKVDFTYENGAASPKITSDLILTVLEEHAVQTEEINSVLSVFWSIFYSADIIIKGTAEGIVATAMEIPLEISGGVIISDQTVLELGLVLKVATRDVGEAEWSDVYSIGGMLGAVFVISDKLSLGVTGRYVYSTDGSTDKSLTVSVRYKP